MERRRAIAWAGSIALTASAGALVVGSLVGGFGLGRLGLGPPPAPVTTPGPQSEDGKPRPTPGGGEMWPTAGGPGIERAAASPGMGSAPAGLRPATGSNPPSPTDGGDGRSSASVPMSPSPAPTNVSGASVPPRDRSSPVTPTGSSGTPVPGPAELPPAAGDTPVGGPPKPATGSVWRWMTAAVLPGLRAVLFGRDSHSVEPAPRETPRPAGHAGASGPSSTQNTAPGRSPDGDPKTVAGNHPTSDHDG